MTKKLKTNSEWYNRIRSALVGVLPHAAQGHIPTWNNLPNELQEQLDGIFDDLRNETLGTALNAEEAAKSLKDAVALLAESAAPFDAACTLLRKLAGMRPLVEEHPKGDPCQHAYTCGGTTCINCGQREEEKAGPKSKVFDMRDGTLNRVYNDLIRELRDTGAVGLKEWSQLTVRHQLAIAGILREVHLAGKEHGWLEYQTNAAKVRQKSRDEGRIDYDGVIAAAKKLKGACYLDDNVLNRHQFTTVNCDVLREIFAALGDKADA